MLSEEEFEAARRTTINAHHTDAGIVEAMWDAMRELGSDGGRVLEPGSGVGTVSRLGSIESSPAPGAAMLSTLAPNDSLYRTRGDSTRDMDAPTRLHRAGRNNRTLVSYRQTRNPRAPRRAASSWGGRRSERHGNW